LPAGILDFMHQGDPEEGFSADPPIQRRRIAPKRSETKWLLCGCHPAMCN
jgi:hypothetical protein